MGCTWYRAGATLITIPNIQRLRTYAKGPRVGLLGGSFNPAHQGHIRLSLEALRWLVLDQVWWLVSPQNPLKASEGMEKLEYRLHLARQLTSKHQRIRSVDLESNLGSIFTVDTLNYLHQHFRDHRFVWLMGADNLLELPNWQKWETIIETTPLAIFSRPGYSYAALSGKAATRYRYYRMKSHPKLLADRAAPAWSFIWAMQDIQSATALRMSQDTC